jgi:hypothetical protein
VLHTGWVFYFFGRETATVTCEMGPSATGAGFDIVIVEPGKPVITEHFTSTADVHKRWQALQERFNGEGWWGPTVSDD